MQLQGYQTALLALTCLVIVHILSAASRFLRSVRIVRNHCIPYLKTPDPRDSVLWWFISPYLAPIFTSRLLPYFARRWFLYQRKDASWFHRGDLPREELGSDVFWTVQPGGLKLWVQDPGVIAEITHRWKEFPKAIEHYGDLELFGQNVITTEGRTWQLHRRITSPPFSEANNHLVWSEAARQSSLFLSSFPPGKDVNDLHFCTGTVALHVISSAGFSLPMSWPMTTSHELRFSPDDKVNASKRGKSSQASLQRAQYMVITCMAFLIVFPRWLLRISPFRMMRDTQRAAGSWKRYLRGIISDARANEKGSNDLLRILVRSSEADAASNGKFSDGNSTGMEETRRNLTDDEIVGNIYVFIFAGHETTAGALESAIIHLALDDELQQTILDEIDALGPEATYTDYKKMPMISCLMLETLRLYPPVVYIPKRTHSTPLTLTYKGTPFTVPPNTSITLDCISSQRHPDYWGPDPHSFRISRWLTSGTPTPNDSSFTYPSKDHPQIRGMPKGSYLPFSEGARSCLGRKFAQVEFAAVIYTLFKNRRIELVVRDGETLEDAKGRCARELGDRQTTVAMRMKGRVPVRFVER